MVCLSLMIHAVFLHGIPLSHPHTCSDGLVCDEPFCEVISVSLHMSVITQNGDSVLMMAVKEGMTEVVPLLLKTGANIHLQNMVKGLCTVPSVKTVDFPLLHSLANISVMQ